EAELASFDRLVERAGDAIERSGIADVELVAVASRAAAILDARGEPERAAAARAVAERVRPPRESRVTSPP
ncbi:MAG: hypothetical protein IT379_33675, partial [Deltaproteobacteria bacterium]|nr:hypothetical protein [Deltaproteobacteria bacterium]